MSEALYESAEIDRNYLQDLTTYCGRRKRMDVSLEEDEREARIMELNRLGGLLGRGMPPQYTRDLLPLLADTAAYAARGYEAVPEYEDAAGRRIRESVAPLARAMFLASCEKVFSVRGTSLNMIRDGANKIHEGYLQLHHNRFLTREEEEVISSETVTITGVYSEDLLQEAKNNTSNLTSPRQQEIIRKLLPEVLGSTGAFFALQQQHDIDGISHEAYAKYRDACLKLVEGAFLLLKGYEAHQKGERRKTIAVTTRAASPSVVSGEAVNRAAAAWEERRPQGQAYIEGKEADFSKEALSRDPFERIMEARSQAECARAFTPEIRRIALEHLLSGVDDRISAGIRLQQPNTLLGCDRLGHALGNGPYLAVYQCIVFACTGQFRTGQEIGAMKVVAFARDVLGYDLAKDLKRAELLEKYTNMLK